VGSTRIEIDSSGRLVALPAVFDDYQADISYLPQFIMRLAMNVEWRYESLSRARKNTNKELSFLWAVTRYEQPCFDTLAQEIARFYSLKKLEDSEGLVERKWTIEHVIFPAIRQRFAPPQAMAQDGTIVQVASLEKLYKVFERC
jgi:DNA mismatch repair protein MLH1